MKTSYLIFLHLLISIPSVIAQSCLQSLNPGDNEQLSSYDAISPAMVFGQDSVPYVAFSDGSNGGKATVKKYNGTYWENVGAHGLSAGEADYIDLAIDGKGNLYLAYSDATNEHKATVLKYNGTNWTMLGNAFSRSEANYLAITIVGGHPVVIYEDAWSQGKATVKLFDGISWLNVGQEGFSEAEVNYCDIAVDSYGFIYVAYQNELADHFKGVVAKFDGTSWSYVGSSNGFEPDDEVTFVSLAVTPEGTPYVAYQGLYGAGIVKMFNGNSWVQLGDQLAGIAWYTSITLSHQGVPYVAYLDYNVQGKATVKKYENDEWTTVGTPDFTPTDAEQIVVKVNRKGEPYILYTGGNIGYIANSKAYVMKYVDDAWTLVGDAGLSPGNASFTDVAVDGSGIPYIVYSDAANGGKATVIKYENNTWASVGNACSSGAAQYNQIAIDQNGFPYVIFYDAGINDKLMVMMYNGTAWLPLDTANLSRGPYNNTNILVDGSSPTAICISTTGIPYIAFSDGMYNSKITVMKYENTHWSTLGSQGFSAGGVDGISMAVDHSEVPYLFYRERNNLTTTGKTKKFDGSSWVIVGDSSDFINDIYYTNELSIALDSEDNPYILYSTYTYLSSSVKTFKSDSWQTLPHVSSSSVYYQEMAINASDQVYVLQCDAENDYKASLLRYDNNVWTTLGTSDGFALYTSLAFGPTGKGYMAFTNDKVYAYEIDCDNYVVTAVVNPTGENKQSMATLYPNPNNGLFTLELSEDALVFITNDVGLTVSNDDMLAGQHVVDLSDYAKGIYLIKITGQEKNQSIKVVKE